MSKELIEKAKEKFVTILKEQFERVEKMKKQCFVAKEYLEIKLDE